MLVLLLVLLLLLLLLVVVCHLRFVAFRCFVLFRVALNYVVLCCCCGVPWRSVVVNFGLVR